MRTTATQAAVRAGIFYFVLVFALGFVLGLIRIRLFNPNFGAAIGLAIELPIILVLAWIACGWLVRSFRVPTQKQPRLTMGAIAFVLLIVAEFAVAFFGLYQSPLQHLAEYRQPTALIGLAAQILFAAMPLLRLKFIPRR
jgi:hypothetical protein